jgi:hypothetical protein
LPLTDLVFLVAWLFPIAMAVMHRARAIPGRLEEIEEVFLGSPLVDSGRKLEDSPGRHYLKLFRSISNPGKWTREALKALFEAHFYEWHSWGRYLLPLSLILVISGVELKLCRDWVNVQLAPADSTRKSTSQTAGSSAPTVAGTPTPADSGGAQARATANENERPSTSRQGGVGGGAARNRGLTVIMQTLPRDQMARVPAAIVFAILGGFVWSMYEILSRRYSRDLTPQELLEIVMRLIAAIPIGYAFSQLAIGRWDAPLAFAASAFPVRDMRRLMRQQVLAKISSTPGSEKLPTAHLAQVLDGLSNETAARLEELNITTAWDLAYADPVALMARTGYSLRIILAWIDQALLVVYFDGHKTTLSKLAMPCALDLCEFYEKHCLDKETRASKDCRDDPAVVDLANKLEIPASILPERLEALYSDSHVRFLDTCWYADD